MATATHRNNTTRKAGYIRNRTTLVTPKQGRIYYREVSLIACRYNETLFGTILCAAFMASPVTFPRFSGSAILTSDGYVMCTYTDRRGRVRPSAFVGALTDLMGNVEGISKHLKLKGPETEDMIQAIAGWLGADPITGQPVLRNRLAVEVLP